MTMTRMLATMAAAVGILLLGGCASSNSLRIPDSTSSLRVLSPFARLWVAGFVTESVGGVDVNGEAVRLLRAELRKQRGFRVLNGDPLMFESEGVFVDSAYWRRMGEDYGEPLIVTGSVRLKRAPPNIIQRVGRAAAAYVMQPGYFLESRIVLIDGTTGAVVFSDRMPRQVRYGAGRHATPSIMYELMIGRLMPDLIRAVGGEHTSPSR